jgi:hypothetical protein
VQTAQSDSRCEERRDAKIRWLGDCMHNSIQHALSQAAEAREEGRLTGDHRLKAKWLKVAQMQEGVAAEYRHIQTL